MSTRRVVARAENSRGCILAAIACLLSFSLAACSDYINPLYPRPVYESSEVYQRFTFGPGLHTQTVVYQGVSGWLDGENGRKLEWSDCASLGKWYLSTIRDDAPQFIFSPSKVRVALIYEEGESWIGGYVELSEPEHTVIGVTEWDDHESVTAEDVERIRAAACVNP